METVAAAGHTEEEVVPSRATGRFYVAIGVSSILAGILLVVFPDTLAALSVILGVELLLLGALELADAVTEEDPTGRTLQVVLSLIAIIAGVVVLRRPAETLVVVVLAAGIYLLVSGLTLVVRALVNARRRGPGAIGGLTLLIVGIVIVSWPDLSLRTLAVLVGLGLIVRGVTALGVAYVVRILRTEPASA